MGEALVGIVMPDMTDEVGSRTRRMGRSCRGRCIVSVV